VFIPLQVRVNGSLAYDRAISVTGDRLKAFQMAAGDMTEPFTAIGETILTNVALTMYSQGGGTWAPLSPVYGAWKEAKAPGTPILWGLRPLHKGTREHPTRPETYAVSGKMAAALMDPASIHPGPQSLLYTPDSNIAGYHLTGTSKMPARPEFNFTAALLHSWDREFVVWLDALIERAGL
jgi:hypothetical protein